MLLLSQKKRDKKRLNRKLKPWYVVVILCEWKRESGWLESWEGLLLATDVSTTLYGSHIQSQVIDLVSWKKPLMRLVVKTCAPIGYVNDGVARRTINNVLLVSVEYLFLRCGKSWQRFIEVSSVEVSKPAFKCNSSIVVGTVSNARSRVPVDSVACS